jgi:cytochrome c oxidase cbb3-type subunit 3
MYTQQHRGSPSFSHSLVRRLIGRRHGTSALAVAVLLLVAGHGRGYAGQEHGQFSQADIQYGAAIYAAQCVGCHGPNGDQISGVNLRGGKFKRASTDDQLRGLIFTGIAGTAMPAFNFDPSELTGIVAYVRNMDAFDARAVAIGKAEPGRAVFEGKGACMTCHRVNGKGSRQGPNLSQIGSRRPASVLQQSLLDPTGSMVPSNRSVRAVAHDGTVVTGRRLNEDTYTVQLIDAQGRLTSLMKADLREYTVLTTSLMPSYKDKLAPQELADVLAYLLSLKGPKS